MSEDKRIDYFFRKVECDYVTEIQESPEFLEVSYVKNGASNYARVYGSSEESFNRLWLYS